MKLFTIILVGILITTSSTSFATETQDKNTSLGGYKRMGSLIVTCKIILRLALARAEGGLEQDKQSDYVGCIKDMKALAKENLDKALRKVNKSKTQEALKSYHVAFITALEGIRPGSDELKINYEQRQQALQDKLTEAWARVEVEQ